MLGSRDGARSQEPYERERNVRKRIAELVATLSAAAILCMIAWSQIASMRSDKRYSEEFMAFYTVGHMLNESSSGLYEPTSFVSEYEKLFPRPASGAPLYAHAPFEAVFFQPFALLPFRSAFVAWQVVSVVFIAAGFSLVWLTAESLPRALLPLALLLAMSSQSVSISLIFHGQVSALVFLWIALGIWFQRRGLEWASGLVLSLCLSKPTLLILVLPMLVVGRRWRALLGFAVGTALVSVVSLMVVGWRGCVDYVSTLLTFGRVATAGQGTFSPPSLYVDLNSFIRMLTGWSGAIPFLLLIGVGACVVPGLVGIWRRSHEGRTRDLALAWACTLTWTMLLNVYVPRYDTPIVMLGILLMVDQLLTTRQRRVPPLSQTLFGLLYVLPWIPPVPIGDVGLLQPYTLILAALGIHQLWLANAMTTPTSTG